MSITTARVAQVAASKEDATVVYVKSASGNVYRFKQAVPMKKVSGFVDRVRKKGVINLHAWKKVRDGGYRETRTCPNCAKVQNSTAYTEQCLVGSDTPKGAA